MNPNHFQVEGIVLGSIASVLKFMRALDEKLWERGDELKREMLDNEQIIFNRVVSGEVPLDETDMYFIFKGHHETCECGCQDTSPEDKFNEQMETSRAEVLAELIDMLEGFPQKKGLEMYRWPAESDLYSSKLVVGIAEDVPSIDEMSSEVVLVNRSWAEFSSEQLQLLGGSERLVRVRLPV